MYKQQDDGISAAFQFLFTHQIMLLLHHDMQPFYQNMTRIKNKHFLNNTYHIGLIVNKVCKSFVVLYSQCSFVSCKRLKIIDKKEAVGSKSKCLELPMWDQIKLDLVMHVCCQCLWGNFMKLKQLMYKCQMILKIGFCDRLLIFYQRFSNYLHCLKSLDWKTGKKISTIC